jgi:hypothetical protein
MVSPGLPEGCSGESQRIGDSRAVWSVPYRPAARQHAPHWGQNCSCGKALPIFAPHFEQYNSFLAYSIYNQLPYTRKITLRALATLEEFPKYRGKESAAISF